ncbi:MAG: response regulator [Nitrospirae bacterium]|nr:response regulator [Nitrospirota bacterium]
MTSQNPPCTVLVIDPCPETQARIVTYVQGRGFSIIAASDPSTALTTIAFAAPDIVITDMFLPEGAGLALAKEIRARHELCPVILMAKDATELAVVHAFRAGAVDYLHKPVVEEELAHALQRARHLPAGDLAGLPGVQRSEHRLTMDSDPAHLPRVISCLIETTASTLSATQRLRLRGSLQELLFNAVEHGNLEIFYQEKRKALSENRYGQLLRQRLTQTPLKDRQVTVQVLCDKGSKSLVYRITDEGKGFKWRSMLNQSQEVCNSEDVNGRGIFMARSFFPSLAYNDRGNEVTITVPLN